MGGGAHWLSAHEGDIEGATTYCNQAAAKGWGERGLGGGEGGGVRRKSNS